MTLEEFKVETEKCALSIMDLVIDNSPKVIISALVACIKTVVSLSAVTDDDGAAVIQLVKKKLDDYVNYELDDLNELMKSRQNEEVH